jgi:hypothetical protein
VNSSREYKMKKYGLLLAAIVLLAPLAAVAKEKPEWRNWPMGDRMVGTIGYYRPKLNTDAAIALQGADIGALISFEETLGLSDSKGTAILALKWRISKRNELSLNYFKLDRDSNKDVELLVFIPEVCEPDCSVQLPISSLFNIESVDITYAFSAIFTEKHNLAFGLGLALQHLQFGFKPSENCVPTLGEEICDRVKPQEMKATAPLPTFKVVYQYAINDKWIVNTDMGYFALSLELDKDNGEEMSGRIVNASAGIQWKTWKHVGFNLGYKLFDVDLEYERSGTIPYKAEANYDYHGFILGIDGYF